ncbi:hypothetical protein B0T13DRAFT_523703 [Neurospora crassa]|nr:hypothetical protein B0T13DRAFT_523703 [Neurospora crassa]
MIPVRTAAAPSPPPSPSPSPTITAVIFRVTWYLLLATFFYSTCVASASINVVRRDGNGDNGVIPAGRTQSLTLPFTSHSNSQAGRPQKRSKTEHVILCDCLSAQGIRSSQMAYYSAEVHGLPTGGVASVETKFNTTAAWYNDTTSATWADTGRAKTGFSYDLNGDGNVCALMIDCNKDTAPLIGIAVGIVGAFILLAGGASFLLVARRRQMIRKRQQEQEQRQRKEARTESTITDSNIVRCEMDGVDGEIKEKMDDLLAEADVKEVIISNEKADSKKAIIDEEIDEKKKKKGCVGGVSEKEEEVRRDKEEREREREREQQEQEQKQQLEEQKRNRDAEQLPPVSPLSPLLPAWAAGAGQKFMTEDFRAYKEKNNDNDKDETNFKFRFEEETQKYMKVEVPSPAGAAGNGEDVRAPEDASSGSQEGKEEEGLP